MTRAGDYIRLEAARTLGGDVQVANLQGKSVTINGHDIALDGTVRADGDVRVSALDERDCTGQTCTEEMRQGSIVQNGTVLSRAGDVAFSGTSSVTWGDLTSTGRSGSLKQSATARTQAGNDVSIRMRSVEAGNITAGNRIDIAASSTRLNGPLSAKFIQVPENTQNKEGNLRIRQ